MNLVDLKNSFERRVSVENGKFAEKYPTHLSDMHAAHAEFGTQVKTALLAGDQQGEVLTKLGTSFANTKAKLSRFAALEKNGWVHKSGTPEEFRAAKEAYDKASTQYENFLAGKEKVKIPGASGEVEVGVSDAVKAAYEKASAATQKVKSVMDHMFGMAKVEGMGFTAKHNLNKFNVFSKEARIPTSNKDLAIRGGGMAVGAVMTIDALARGKDKEGEPRGGYTRLLEGLAGLGLVGGGLLAGHAR